MIHTFDKLYSLAPKELQEWFDKCEKTPQNKDWHPEGPNEKIPHNVLIHIKIVYERARKFGNMDYALAAFFHDLGKAETTKLNRKGNWSSYGHEFLSARLVLQFQDWINRQGGNRDIIYEIVLGHMRIKLMDEMNTSKQEKLKKSFVFKHLIQFSEFDNMKTLTPEEFSL